MKIRQPLKKRPITVEKCCRNCKYADPDFIWKQGAEDYEEVKDAFRCSIDYVEKIEDYRKVKEDHVCKKFEVREHLKEKREPNKKVTLDEIKQYHWSCPICAKEAGGEIYSTEGVVMIRGFCEVCKREDATMIQWVDFVWPNEKK